MMYFTTGPVWVILLLPPFLSTQDTTEFPFRTTPPEFESPTDIRLNGTETLVGSSDSPQPSVSNQVPSEAEGDDWTPTEAFLFSGDPSVLELGECTRAYSLSEQKGTLPLNFFFPLRTAMDALANTANFLNMIFQASDLRESSVREDMEWYHALVRSLLEADPIIRRAVLTFDADPASPMPQLLLRASRSSTPKVQIILLQDLSNAWKSLHPPAPAPDDSWFSRFKFPSTNQPLASALSKRVLLNDLNTLDTPKWGQGDSYVTNRTGVRWSDVPYLECEDGRFLPGWLVTLSTSFYGLKPDLTPEFRGVVRVDVNIQDFDIDQCATGSGWFANTHQCNRTTMTCEPIPGKGFQLGQYCCRCKEGYYSPPMDTQDSLRETVNGSTSSSGGIGGGTACYPTLPVCLPCWPGCRRCEDSTPCWVQEDWILRAGVLAIQGFFMLLVFISMLVAYQFRRSRRIRASGLLLLETILFGSLLLYFPVFILYFKPSTFRCILLRWVRMLGFAIVYGTVTLKMYRVLKVFLSRTAQRVPYMSSTHLLRILGIMVMTVSWFLCAWTVSVLQNRDRNVPLLVTSITSDGQGFSLCDLDRWDYMMAIAELLFLCWGSFLCSAVKPVPSAFHEPRYMGIAIHNELLLSSMFHLLRFVLPSLHPDWMLLLFFTHTHVTVTVTLALLFVPKFIHVSRPGREEIAAEVYEDEVDLRRSGSYLNSSFTSAWSDHNLDPDDIRDELKKLYAQLEVHKTKKMTSNNPHIQKKRSSRLGLGRSIIKRISEIPESMSRQCSREDREFSLTSRGLSQTESYKKTSETVSVKYKDKSPILRKSQSEHDNARDKDPSLHDSMMRANLAKRASQRSETDSLDIAPVVCKSASAHNLTVDNNLLHPYHNKLYKSQSLTSSKAHSLEDTSRAGRDSLTMQIQGKPDIPIKDQTTNALQSKSFDKTEVCPWELEEQKPTDKNQKHVTYDLSQTIDSMSLDNLSSPLAQHICPWDHLPSPPLSVCATGEPCQESGDKECESPKPQLQVSCSAPGSPVLNQEKTGKEHRVFSLRTSTQKWLSVKAFMGSVDGSLKEKVRKNGNEKTEDSISVKDQDTVSTGSKSTISSRNPSLEQKKNQKRILTVDTKPCLVKQAAVRLSSGDSSERSPRRIVIVKSGVHPWESENVPKDGMYDNVFIHRTLSTQSTNDMSRTARTPLAHRRSGNQIMPALGALYGDVGPLDITGSSRISPQRQQSTTADVCPWEVEEAQVSERASVCPWESQAEAVLTKQDSIRGDVCPWESQDLPSPNTPLCLLSQQIPQLPNRRETDICPWEGVEISEATKTEVSLHVDVGTPTNVDDSKMFRPKEKKELPQAPERSETVRVNVCPWESENVFTEDLQTKGTTLDKTTTGTSQWNSPEPPQNMAEISSLKEESANLSLTKHANVLSFSQETPATKTNIFLLKTGDPNKPHEKNSSQGHICPWETGNTDNPGQTQITGANIPAIQNDICPWDRGDLETTNEIDRIKVNVCPWETEEHMTEHQVNNWTDVSKEAEGSGKQDRAQVHVSPWETDALKKTENSDRVRVDLCPWEGGNAQTKILKIQDRTQSPICHLETDEHKKKDGTQVDVSKVKINLNKQDSTRADVCPWETENRATIKTQDSTRADACPWETENRATIKTQDSTRADACPWETENRATIKPQDSTRADACPWETENRATLKPQDSTRADACPWETENRATLKPQDSTRADACPWESVEPGWIERPEDAQRAYSKKTEEDNTNVNNCLKETTETESLKGQDRSCADSGTTRTDGFKGSELGKRPEGGQEGLCSMTNEEPYRSTEDVTHTQTAPSSEESDLGQLDGRMQPTGEAKANIPLARRDALCPWQMEDSKPGFISEHDSASDVFTWEPEDIPEEDEEDDAECAAEAFVFPDDL